MGHRRDEGNLPTHSLGAVLHLDREVQPKPVSESLDASPAGNSARLKRPVDDFPALEVWIEPCLARQVAGAAPDFRAVADDIEAQHPSRSARRLQEAQQGAQGRRLPRTIRPEETEDFALPHRQRKLPNANTASVVFREGGCFNHVHRGVRGSHRHRANAFSSKHIVCGRILCSQTISAVGESSRESSRLWIA
jgi:hypothetical protein